MVEFLLDCSGGFYFMEMNIWIQVEYLVIEMVMGVDLIVEQLCIVGGEFISVQQEEIQFIGYVIECCINVEDVWYNFCFVFGCIMGWLFFGGLGVCVDSYVYMGYDILFFYDFLIGKLIVWGKDCDYVMMWMKWVLNECVVIGILIMVEFYLEMLDWLEFINGDVYIKFVE